MQQRAKDHSGGGMSLSCDKFRGIANCIVGDGSTVMFWSDI
jgi:hypothetical protein